MVATQVRKTGLPVASKGSVPGWESFWSAERQTVQLTSTATAETRVGAPEGLGVKPGTSPGFLLGSPATAHAKVLAITLNKALPP